jgi:hypothetical protein
LGAERVWALEGCRHVCGVFERFLLVTGERVVGVATSLVAGERRGGRARGKSDLIDASAVARAALRGGVDRLPVAEPASRRGSGGRCGRWPNDGIEGVCVQLLPHTGSSWTHAPLHRCC